MLIKQTESGGALRSGKGCRRLHMGAPMKTFLSRLPCIPARCKARITPLFVPVFLGAMLLSGVANGQEPSKKPSGTWSVEDVLNMVKSGLKDELIIAAIKSKGKAFDLNGAEIKELVNSGVNQTVIEYLLDPAKPYAP